MGFVVEHFENGIYLEGTTDSRIHLNESRLDETGSGAAPKWRGIGILLLNSSRNAVTQNVLSRNGRNGITLTGSSHNTIRGNRLDDNHQEKGGCNLMLQNGSNDNTLVENQVVGMFGAGIMLGPGPLAVTGNQVKQNRIHGFQGPGVLALLPAAQNVIAQNNATGNGTGATPYDLHDDSQPSDNFWNNNLGRCTPGMC